MTRMFGRVSGSTGVTVGDGEGGVGVTVWEGLGFVGSGTGVGVREVHAATKSAVSTIAISDRCRIAVGPFSVKVRSGATVRREC